MSSFISLSHLIYDFHYHRCNSTEIAWIVLMCFCCCFCSFCLTLFVASFPLCRDHKNEVLFFQWTALKTNCTKDAPCPNDRQTTFFRVFLRIRSDVRILERLQWGQVNNPGDKINREGGQKQSRHSKHTIEINSYALSLGYMNMYEYIYYRGSPSVANAPYCTVRRFGW